MRLAIVARSTENGIFTVFENVPEKSDQLDKKKKLKRFARSHSALVNKK